MGATEQSAFGGSPTVLAASGGPSLSSTFALGPSHFFHHLYTDTTRVTRSKSAGPHEPKNASEFDALQRRFAEYLFSGEALAAFLQLPMEEQKTVAIATIRMGGPKFRTILKSSVAYEDVVYCVGEYRFKVTRWLEEDRADVVFDFVFIIPDSGTPPESFEQAGYPAGGHGW